MNNMFDIEPRIIPEGSEPSPRKIIYLYYYSTGYYSKEEASNLAEAYISSWNKKYLEQLVVN